MFTGVLEEEFFFVRYIERGQPVTMYLSLQPVPSGDAKGIKQALHDAFEEVGIPLNQWQPRLISMRTDGASVNTGKDNGLIAIMKRDGMLWLLGVWCVAHKMELALLDALKNEKELQDAKELLQGIYKHYKYSPKAGRELREVATALETDTLVASNILGMRWAPHLHRAIDVLLEHNFLPMYTHFEHTAEAKTSSPTMVGRARKIRAQLSSYKTLLFLHLMWDVLKCAKKISLEFQKDSCTVSTASDQLETFCMLMEKMKVRNGEKIQAFLDSVKRHQDEEEIQATWKGVTLTIGAQDDERFNRRKETIITTIIQAYRKRFGFLEEPLFKAAEVLDPSNWPADQQELATYGDNEVLQLAEHFEDFLALYDFQLAAIADEWVELKVHGRRLSKSFSTFWHRALTNGMDARCPNICILGALVMCLPMNTACCERSFSIMKKIKTDWRASLSPSTLSGLMRVSIEGAKVNDFDLQPVVNKWWHKGERARRPNQIASGPRVAGADADAELEPEEFSE